MTPVFETTLTFKRIVENEQKFPFQEYGHSDSDWIMSAVQLMENCFPNSVVMLCKIKHPEISYVSRNCHSVIGYTAQQVKGTSAEEHFKLVHPEDRESVLKLYERLEQHTALTEYRPENWKFAFHYRFRTGNGNYIHIQDEKAAFLHSSGKYVYYSILSTPDDQGTSRFPFMALSKRFNNTFRKIDIYVPKTENEFLTRREQEVLKCLEAGLSTKEIASRLSVSPNTIRNHKASLFRKTKSKSGLQALKNARNLQLL
jgi:DNA-binding CsgD family transcriptional regulator